MIDSRNFSFANSGDKIASMVVHGVSALGLIVMVFILWFLFAEGIPVLKSVTIGDIFRSSDWYPAEEPPALGMFAIISGTLIVTLLSSLIALPVSYLFAIFTAEIAPSWLRNILKPMLELLGFLPSIVLGFLGMVVVAPWMQGSFEILTGLNLLNASIFLGIMILPIVGSLVEEALSSIPEELRYASFALGATKWETISKVVFPAALPGILSASLLGIMRSMGETMVVLMVAGGAAIIPDSIFDPIRPLTSTIAAEMGETPVGSAHYHALFFAGLLLFLITLALNMLSAWIESKGKIAQQ
ncbi:MAG: phosphate ABC transporter permease subunit PstC [Synergistaceae bacterium]|nr:phosphate ABC transporter permease subunit PstC [Synergistaceae bacterium]